MRTDKEDREEHELLDRVMEYARTVGLEVTDMLMTVHEKVHALEPCVPDQHTLGVMASRTSFAIIKII